MDTETIKTSDIVIPILFVSFIFLLPWFTRFWFDYWDWVYELPEKLKQRRIEKALRRERNRK